jgi:tetratricopeptide (TPR) repeat protein
MNKKIYSPFIIIILQIVITSNVRLAYAETLPNKPSYTADKPIIDCNKSVDSNQVVILKSTCSNGLPNEELDTQPKIYKLECLRIEMDNYKWIIQYSLTAMGVIVAILAIIVTAGGIIATIVIYKFSNRIGKTEDKVEVKDLWNKAGTAYAMGHYEEAAEIWNQIYKKFKPNTRQFFNNWGSSLLNWAGTIEKREEQKGLANEAIKKYLKAEEFTEGTAAYNIACCHAILDDSDKCKEWLETAKRTSKLLSLEQAKTDRDLKKYAKEVWFLKIWE